MKVQHGGWSTRLYPQVPIFFGALALIIAAVCAFQFRHELLDSHDQGFSVPPKNKAAPMSVSETNYIVSAAGQYMTLDPTRHYLMNSITRRPVFVTGDSAWSLITELNNSDVELYLSDRAAKGFNYIWCGAADNYYQSNAPRDYYGNSPFDGADFTHEDAAYWAHVDFVLSRAAAHGMTVTLDPGFVGLNSTVGYLASYQNTSDTVITDYGEFLGDRYKNFRNLIWALGGDVDPSSGVVPKLTDLANGIRSRDAVHLIVAEGQPQHA